MFWTITTIILILTLLILGVIRILLEADKRKLRSKPKKAVNVALAIAFVTAIFSIIQIVKPSKTDEILEEVRELRRETGEPIPYEDGIPQSENLNLKRLFTLGKKHLKDYEYDKAIKSLRAGLALQDVQLSEEAALLIHIGIAQYKQNKWDQALGSWKDALGTAEEAEDKYGQAAALENLGLVYQAKGEWDKAIEFYDKALKGLEKIGDEHGMAGTFNNLAGVYFLKGEWKKAKESYEKSLKIKERIGDEYEMSQSFTGLGLVYQAKGDWDKAIEFYEKSLKIKEKIGDEHGMAQTKANIGILYKEQGKKDEARRLLEESLRTLERIGDRPSAEIVREHLSAMGRSRSSGEDL